MAGHKLEEFGGEVPRRSDRLLDPRNAAVARNAKLLSGAIRPLKNIREAHDFGDTTIVKAYRVRDPGNLTNFFWTGFDRLDVDMLKGPLLNDKYERYYCFGGGQPPKYNTATRIQNGDPWYSLGVPPPVNQPMVTQDDSGVQLQVTRSYVYTFYSEYGEESAPSTPSDSVIGAPDSVWTVSNMDTSILDAENRPTFTKRIYRTVSGFQSTSFFFVDEIPLTQDTYVDTTSDEVVSRNEILQSTSWQPPPQDLEGAVVMPNGFFVAWSDRNLYFCEPYRPHAWPADYDRSTEFPVVGLGVYGQSLAVMTDGNPYAGAGVAPASFTLTKYNTAEPCLSRHGIVPMPFGVVYPGINGLMLISSQGVDVMTRNLVTKDEWKTAYVPNNLKAAKFGSQYIGFYSSDEGYTLDPAEPTAAFITLDVFDSIANIQSDYWSGETYVIRSGVVGWWDDETMPPVRYTWRSKLFDFPRPLNWGMAKLELECEGEVLSSGSTEEIIRVAKEWNAQRILLPLSSLGDTNAIGSSGDFSYVTDPMMYDNRQALGGSPLVSTTDIDRELLNVTFSMYDECGNLILTRVRTSDEQFRLPSGYKKSHYYFEVAGRRDVYAIKLGETGKDLVNL